MHFQPVLPPGAVVDKITVNGVSAKEWGTRETEQGWVVADFGFWFDTTAIVQIKWHGGITALPLTYDPKPGDHSIGYRIISTSFESNTYKIILEGPQNTSQQFRVWAANPGDYIVEGAEVQDINGNILTLSVDFPAADEKYIMREVSLIKR
jgi:hypothetical protein